MLSHLPFQSTRHKSFHSLPSPVEKEKKKKKHIEIYKYLFGDCLIAFTVIFRIVLLSCDIKCIIIVKKNLIENNTSRPSKTFPLLRANSFYCLLRAYPKRCEVLNLA